MPFSEYIVYADESGDHALDTIDQEYPVFVLSFCIIKKSAYASEIVPQFQRLKFDTWGHDSAVFHEREIRRQEGYFSFLRSDHQTRDKFFADLNGIIQNSPMALVAAVIDKRALIQRYNTPHNPYDISLFFCLERLHRHLIRAGEKSKTAHIVFEARGAKEGEELRNEFQMIVSNERQIGNSPHFTEIHYESAFVPKKANSTGLQLADLTARPIRLKHLRPDQPNRAFELIAPKLTWKVFPKT